jgi:hypothetical protein
MATVTAHGTGDKRPRRGQTEVLTRNARQVVTVLAFAVGAYATISGLARSLP